MVKAKKPKKKNEEIPNSQLKRNKKKMNEDDIDEKSSWYLIY